MGRPDIGEHDLEAEERRKALQLHDSRIQVAVGVLDDGEVDGRELGERAAVAAGVRFRHRRLRAGDEGRIAEQGHDLLGCRGQPVEQVAAEKERRLRHGKRDRAAESRLEVAAHAPVELGTPDVVERGPQRTLHQISPAVR